MLKRILVGLNGTEFSSAAMDLAIAVANRHGASLMGLGIVDVPYLTAPESVPLGAGPFKQRQDTAVLQAEHAKIDQVLSEFLERCRTAGVNSLADKRVGTPATILSEQSQESDLLIVGKKRFAENEWDQTSHTLDQLLRHSPRPVLCVPAVRSDRASVLIAYDGSIQAARTLQMYVASGLMVDDTMYVVALGNHAREHAERAKVFLTAHSLAPQIIVEESSKQPGRRLLEIADKFQAGLIVLGCYGQPRFKEFLFGSVTKSILTDTTTPLFLYH